MPRIARVRPEGYLPERQYQRQARQMLMRLYPEVEVTVQWYPFVGERRDMYWPVVDIAVGPFAIHDRYGDRYTQLMERTRPFIQTLIYSHNRNVEVLEEQMHFNMLRDFNENARCLFCIEIEESGSKKHCLGNLVNASALGRIGILVARTDAVLRTFVRQRAYFKFLAEVEKNTFKTANALILTAAQFDECLARGIAG
jgi:hypothetical protein